MGKNNKKTVIAYLLPATMLVVVLLYIPVLLNLLNSMYSWGSRSTKREFVGLANYTKLFSDPVFIIAIKNVCIFMLVSLVFQIGLAFVIAAVLEQPFLRKFSSFFSSVYFIPSLLMTTVVGITFKIMYSPSIGIVNPILTKLGIENASIDLLGNSSSAIWALAAMSQWQYVGYTVLLFVVAIRNVPEDILEAAIIDGASAVKIFFLITLPMLKDTIIVNMIIVITGAIRVYDEVAVTTTGGPGNATETLSTWMYKVGFTEDKMGYASAIAFFIFVISFIIGIFQMKGYKLDEN